MAGSAMGRFLGQAAEYRGLRVVLFLQGPLTRRRDAVAEFTTKPGILPDEDRYDVIDLATGAKLFQVGGMNFDPDWGLLAGSWVFSGDGSTQVTCNQRGLLIREVPSGRELKHIDTNLIATTHGASLSSDGKLLAVTAGSQACLFNLNTGKLLDHVDCGESTCTAVLISPDGHTLATRGRWSTARTSGWDRCSNFGESPINGDQPSRVNGAVSPVSAHSVIHLPNFTIDAG